MEKFKLGSFTVTYKDGRERAFKCLTFPEAAVLYNAYNLRKGIVTGIDYITNELGIRQKFVEIEVFFDDAIANVEPIYS